MAKVTNFLSIALLVSVLAVSPVFAMEGEDVPAVAPAPAQQQQPQDQAPAGEPDQVAPAPSTSFCEKVANVTNWTLDKVDCANPFAYRVETTQANNPTLTRLAKTVTVVALVVTNPAVQGAVNSLVNAITNAVGLGEDDSDEDATEPARLVIGRKA